KKQPAMSPDKKEFGLTGIYFFNLSDFITIPSLRKIWQHSTQGNGTPIAHLSSPWSKASYTSRQTIHGRTSVTQSCLSIGSD
ncbi:hypothetical protein, partial [Pseudomonas synxantha]|uniref:hypothetical protein n=1 Tax=Pseudomonas synxantha TaxID=47883 RepID=UPI001E3CBD9D